MRILFLWPFWVKLLRLNLTHIVFPRPPATAEDQLSMKVARWALAEQADEGIAKREVVTYFGGYRLRVDC